jgi:hypothetical protein
MGGRRIMQAIGARLEPVSLVIVTLLSAALILADANRRLSPEIRLNTFEDQAAALWSVDRPLPDLAAPSIAASVLPAHQHLP